MFRDPCGGYAVFVGDTLDLQGATPWPQVTIDRRPDRGPGGARAKGGLLSRGGIIRCGQESPDARMDELETCPTSEMKHSTNAGGGAGFPLTRHSAIRAVRSNDARERSMGFEVLIAAYWMPVYKHLRIRWEKSTDDAKDLTQGFFLEAMEKDFFGRFDPERARFRTFLKTCLDGFVSNESKSARRLKRGGAVEFTAIDFQDAERQMDAAASEPGESVEMLFEKEWRRSIFSLALDLFQARSLEEGKTVRFELFEKYVLDGLEDGRKIRYEDLARQFGLTTITVTNHLAAARREFRRAVFDKLRELTATEDEFRSEARALLGVEPE